jgi:hypothetical protein
MVSDQPCYQPRISYSRYYISKWGLARVEHVETFGEALAGMQIAGKAADWK